MKENNSLAFYLYKFANGELELSLTFYVKYSIILIEEFIASLNLGGIL